MKTADLIPFILLELKERDKYGFELVKNIENKSSGKIVIKQPTLYTVLKKLEKTKFISSYWLDSEIGGKRHYYKLTENGKKQADTLPNVEVLLKHVLEEDAIETTDENLKSEPAKDEKEFSIFDQISPSEDTQTPELREDIIPSSEAFANSSIDNATELEINSTNIDILKEETITQQEQFASNENVSEFTKTISTIPNEYINKVTKQTGITENFDFNSNINYHFSVDDIQYVDYIDPKLDPILINSKKTAKNVLFKVLSTSAVLLCLLIICSIITNFTGTSPLYYTFFISGVVLLIFYPTMYISHYKQHQIKFQDKKPSFDFKKHLIACFAFELLILLLCVIINISMGNNAISEIFSFTNFENFYAPILLGLTSFADLIFSKIFINKKIKENK
ncbi:MAG: PadR family transcriptional regulator [Clostridia bacterium]|nr:PadR family transcriptional regulator [Clostridia bacterium]